MSQSRARKPLNGGEPGSKGRAFVGKASGDTGSSATAPRTSKQSPLKQNTNKQSLTKQNGDQNHDRITKNIPKSIRYDLENALVGLCDVWFEDIKPHLVRNKIKLHVESEGAGATASGDCARLPPAAPGCSHLDPGAASDRPQQADASFAACCSTQPSASRAQCRRPPAQRPPPSRLPPPSSPTPPVWIAQNKNSKSKSPRQTRTCRKSPQAHRSPAFNWREPQPSWSYSQLLLRHPATQRRRIRTANSTLRSRDENFLLALVPRRRTNTRNKHTQTEIDYETFFHQQHQSPMKRINTEHIPESAPGTRHKSSINQDNSKSDFDKNLAHRLHRTEKRSSTEAYPNPLRNPCLMKCKKPEAATLIRTRERIDIDLVQSKTTRYSVQKQNRYPQEHTSRSRHRGPDMRSMESNPQISPARGRRSRVDPLIATAPPRVKQTGGSQFGRCFATTNLNPSKNEKQRSRNQKQPAAEPSALFDKGLIDIIGERNDKRIRVLYKSPVRDEFPSVMNLVASTSILDKQVSEKHRPWR